MFKFVFMALATVLSMAAHAQNIELRFGVPGNDFGNRWERPQRSVVLCESVKRRQNYCAVEGTVIDARLIQQFSNASCNEFDDWGFDEGGIWVANGCRANFEVIARSSAPSNSEDIACASVKSQANSCPTRRRIVDAELIQQNSNSPCIENVSWGVDRFGIWVDRGCRGTFRVYYR